MPETLNITEHIFVNRPPDVVFDFTQDYERRAEWDSNVIEASVLQTKPLPQVRVRVRGGFQCVFEYKLFDRPRATSLIMRDVVSTMIAGGGGSWQYVAKDGGTLWAQVNSVTLADRKLCKVLRPLIAAMFRYRTRKAMKQAKRLMELKSLRPPFAR